MIILLSPTKQMDFTTPYPTIQTITKIPFNRETTELHSILKGYSPEKIASIMKLSPVLADQTYQDIQRFPGSPSSRRSALFAYSGTVFKSLDPKDFDSGQLEFTRKTLRILSGLYGILEPFSTISPYRLDMKTALELPGRQSLTSFWRPRITDYLRESSTILNLASKEYSDVLDQHSLKSWIITFHFKEKNGDKLRTVGMYAKKARGMMLRRILKERVENFQILKKGNTDGYRYNCKFSTDNDWIFTR